MYTTEMVIYVNRGQERKNARQGRALVGKTG